MTTETETNKTKLLACIETLGLEYSAQFVPFSQSRNAKEKDPSLNWKVTIKKGSQSLTTDYMQGIGHLPHYSQKFSTLVVYDDAVREACESGKSAIIEHKNGYDAAQAGNVIQRKTDIPRPELVDVLYSLVLDSDVLNYSTFEEWAGDFGYDTDSRKGETIYRQCLEIGLKLRSMLGDDTLTKLREAYQDY